MPKPTKSMTFTEWFAWMEDIYKTNPHAHEWLMQSNSPDGEITPAFYPHGKRVII